MMNKRTLYLAAGAAFMSPGDGAVADDQELSPVVVEDQRDETRHGKSGEPAYSRFALPESVQASETLTREDIEALRPRDVSDLLESSLGMSISRQGARVHNFSYDRGDSVSIVLDGVYLTQTEAQRVLGDLPVDMIDSIQFLRDSTVISIGPLMSFGSASNGSPNQGFIVIKTRRLNRPGENGEVRASYASYDTWKTSTFVSHAWQDGRYTLGAGYQRSESGGKLNWNNAYSGDTWLMNGAINDRELIASASLYLNNAEREIQRAIGTYTGTTSYPANGPTPAGVLDKNVWKYKPVDTSVLSINVARPWNDSNTTALTYGLTEAKGTGYYYTTLNPNATGQRFKDRAEEWNLSHTLVSGHNTAKVGMQRIDWYQLSEGSTTARKEAIHGAYVTDEYRITPDWSVDAAYREDRKHILQGGDKYLSSGNLVTLSDGKWTDKATLYSLGSAWQIDRTYRVSGRYSFNKTPTPDVITTRNDAELAAEERQRYELGFEAAFSPALQASLTPFLYRIHNAKVSDGSITKDSAGNTLVDAYGNTTSVTVYKAADRIRRGYELSLQGRLGDGAWGYQVGWTHLDDDHEDGKTGSEFPDNKYSARLNWRSGAWDSTLSVLKVDPYLSYGYTVGDFTTVNLSVARRLRRDLTVTLYGQNLTDEHYGTNNKGYPATANWGVLRDVGATYGVEMAMTF
jgi:outer membrane receptor protein involved in Fe transport